jgi:glycosyltransferase involved in cell wall biosynthesis
VALRVALVTPEFRPESGGIGTNARLVASRLADRGHVVTVVTTDPSVGDAVRRRAAAELPALRRHARLRRLAEIRDRVATARALARLACAASPDLVVAPEWDATAWWLARYARVPVVTRIAGPIYRIRPANGDSLEPHRVQCWFERDQARRSTLVHATSHAMAETIAQDWGIDRGRMVVVPNPVDIQHVRSAATTTLELPARFFAYVGRLEPVKGIRVLAEVLADILRMHPSVHAVFAGRADEPSRAVLDAEAAEVADRIHILDALSWPDTLGVMSRAELVVLPALYETFPNVALEAMALRRPIVASGINGLAEAVRDGETGWLVPPGDAPALRDTMIAALGAPEELRRFGESAGVWVERYDADRVIDELVALYERALARA